MDLFGAGLVAGFALACVGFLVVQFLLFRRDYANLRDEVLYEIRKALNE
jgi:hypothetical protein